MRLRRVGELPPASLLQKEWWFGFAHDAAAGTYLSWSFVRSFAVDQFRFLVADLETGTTVAGKHTLLHLGGDQEPPMGSPGVSLSYRRGPLLRYLDRAGHEAVLSASGLRGADGQAAALDLLIERSATPFTSRQESGPYRYELAHRFGDRIRGRVTIDGRHIDLDTSVTYTDHCFGVVPARTRWEWVAATGVDPAGNSVAMAVLRNHGEHGQRYAQVFSQGGWHRLSPIVEVDRDSRDPLRPWRLTSPELQVTVTPAAVHGDRVQIPPLLPFLVNLRHDELIVSCTGSVRLGDATVDLGTLWGVGELHDGRW
jgi:hypothetical protein